MKNMDLERYPLPPSILVFLAAAWEQVIPICFFSNGVELGFTQSFFLFLFFSVSYARRKANRPLPPQRGRQPLFFVFVFASVQGVCSFFGEEEGTYLFSFPGLL